MGPAASWKKVSTYGVAKFAFAATGPLMLSLNPGEPVYITDECNGWYRGGLLQGEAKGIFPSNYIRLTPNVDPSDLMRSKPNPPSTSNQGSTIGILREKDPILDEIIMVLREWGCEMKRLLEDKKFAEGDTLKDRMSELVRLRKHMLTLHAEGDSKDPRRDQRKELKQRAIRIIEEGSRILGLDLIVRDKHGIRADDTNTPIVELYRAFKAISPDRQENTAASPLQDQKFKEEPLVQILVDVKACMFTAGSETEVHIGLHRGGELVSDEFSFQLTALGMPRDPQLINNTRCVFRDIVAADAKEMVLTFRVFKLCAAEFAARVPYATCSFTIGAVLLKGLEDESEIVPDPLPLFTPSNERLANSIGVALGLTFIKGASSQRNPKLESVPVCSLSIFGSSIQPGLARNDLYISLDSATLSPEYKYAFISIQASWNSATKYSTSVAGSSASSFVFNECAKVPLLETYGSIAQQLVIFTIHTLSSLKSSAKAEPSMFTFLRVVDSSGMPLSDEKRTLPVYKWQKGWKNPPIELMALEDPSNSEVLQKLLCKKDTVTVSSRLISTKLTQDRILHVLLNWRMFPLEWADALKRFTFLDAVEITKFVREIFDALFSLLDNQSGQETDDLVCSALSFVVAELSGRYRETLDVYVENHISSRLAWRTILRYIQRNVQDRGVAKAAGYLFKFATSSYEKLPNHTQFVEEMRSMVDGVIQGFNAMLNMTEPATIIASQTILLRQLPLIYSSISSLFTPGELGGRIRALYQSIRSDVSSKEWLRNKTRMLRHFVADTVILKEKTAFEHCVDCLIQEVRNLDDIETTMDLVDNVQRCALLTSNNELLFFQLWSDMGAKFVSEGANPPEQLLVAYLTLFKILGSNRIRSRHLKPAVILDIIEIVLRKNPIAPHWSSMSSFSMLSLFEQLCLVFELLTGQISAAFDSELWRRLFNSMFDLLLLDRLQIEDLPPSRAISLLNGSVGDLRPKVFAKIKESWAMVDTHQRTLVAQMLDGLFRMTRCKSRVYIDGSLQLIMEVLRYSRAQERVVELINQYVTNRWWDSFMRGYFISFMKEKAGLKAGSMPSSTTAPAMYVSNLTLPVVETVTVIHETDKSAKAPLVAAELASSKRTKGIDYELSSDAYVSFLTKFSNELSQLLDLLTSVAKYRPVPEEEDDLVQSLLRLLSFLLDYDRYDLYVHYVDQLIVSHAQLGNFTEAGYAQLMHRSIIDNVQKAIAFFEQGKDWEKCVTLLKRVEDYYERKMFDYAKVAESLNRRATCVLKIVERERFFAEYFRVCYWGKSWDDEISLNVGDINGRRGHGRDFVYRGRELERLGEFCSKITKRFPNAEILKGMEPPHADVVQGMAQVVQVITVTPSSIDELRASSRAYPCDVNLSYPPPACVSEEANHARANLGHLPPNIVSPSESVVSSAPFALISKFSQHDCVRVFKYSRMMKTGEKKDTYLVTKDSFPTIHRRSVVSHYITFTLMPLDVAVSTIDQKNADFVRVLQDYEQTNTTDVNRLGMMLNGVIDAAINGGVQKYIDAFFTKRFCHENMAMLEKLRTLQRLLAVQVDLLADGLRVHAVVGGAKLAGLQQKLEVFYARMKSECDRVKLFEVREYALEELEPMAATEVVEIVEPAKAPSPTNVQSPAASSITNAYSWFASQSSAATDEEDEYVEYHVRL